MRAAMARVSRRKEELQLCRQTAQWHRAVKRAAEEMRRMPWERRRSGTAIGAATT